MASTIRRWRRILTSVFCSPFESQGLNLLVLLVLVFVATEAQAGVAVLAFAFRILCPSPHLLFLLVVVLLIVVFLVIVLIILQVAILLLVSLETCALLVANELDDSSLIDASLLVVEWEATTVKNRSQTFSSSIGVGLGVSQKLKFRVDIFAILCLVGSGNVDGGYR
jgi:hypothetical protein